jgi:hypothetical protein
MQAGGPSFVRTAFASVVTSIFGICSTFRKAVSMDELALTVASLLLAVTDTVDVTPTG